MKTRKISQKLSGLSFFNFYNFIFGFCMTTGLLWFGNEILSIFNNPLLSYRKIILACTALFYYTGLHIIIKKRNLFLSAFLTVLLIGTFLFPSNYQKILFCSLIAALLASLLQTKKQLLIGYLCFIIAVGILATYHDTILSRYSVILMLFLGGTILSFYVNNDALHIMPIYAILMIPLFILPSHNHPYGWTNFKKAINPIIEQIQYMGICVQSDVLDGSSPFRNSTGYSKDTTLWNGPLQKSFQRQLLVNGSKRTDSVYFTGATYGTYTGHSWTNKTVKNFSNSSRDNLLLRLCAFLNAKENNVHVAPLSNTFKLYHVNLITSDLIHEESPLAIDTEDKIIDENGTLHYPQKHGKDHSIKTNSLEINYNDFATRKWLLSLNNYYPYFIDRKYPKQIYDYTMAQLQFYVNNISTNQLPNDWSDINLPEELSNYNEWVTKNYLSVPQKNKKRLGVLAAKICSDYSSGTNLYAKCCAIEQYFHENYLYTLDPKKAKKEKDPLNAFIFETKQGYCSSFATAMVLMLRTQGIPSRYVEGYYLGNHKQEQYQTFELTGMDAHAWVEAYIPDIGFVRFDPTPSYTATFSSSDKKMDAEKTKKEKSAKIKNEKKTQFKKQVSKNNEKLSISFLKNNCVIFMLCVLIVITLLFIANLRIRRKKYIQSSPEKKVKHKLRWSLRYLRLLGITMKPSETLDEFLNRISLYELDKDKKTFLLHFEKIRYGNPNPSEAAESMQYIEDYSKKIKKLCLTYHFSTKKKRKKA